MARPRRLATIAPHRPFLDTLASGLLAAAGDGVEALTEQTILLPTRRACRALVEAFLRAGDGRPLLLPRIRPLGDIDEDDVGLAPGAEATAPDLPPAMPEARRRLLLARLILAWKRKRGEDIAPDQALRLAAELARLIDQVQTERLGFAGLAALVPDEYASHWQDTLDFLAIVTERWPPILEEQGCIDPAERRNRLLERQAEAWRREPPQTPVIAAGSTGSIPATADLLEVVADLPAGLVILPGLDRDMDARTRAAARADPAHPQHGMLRLLERLEIDPDDVAEWNAAAGPGATATSSPRVLLAAEALRPAATTDAWRELGDLPAAATEDVERVDCANEAEEAGVVALMLRQALEEPGRTAALVTPDRLLARRVAAELLRWGVAVDDSAGRPLARTPPGEFLRLVARAVAAGFPPVALLAALKHPLAAGGMASARFRRLVRAFEVAALRGPRPAPGIDGLRELVAATPGRARRFAPLLDGLERRLGPLARELDGRDRPLDALVGAHVAAAEALAETDELPGAARLWAGDDGEAAANAVAEMHGAAGALGTLAGAEYAALFETLLAGTVVRPRFGRHPRLHIWGPLEARLQHADLVVLAGLNEGTWPADPGNDPWLSRPMRAEFGLPSPERRIGLAAHDFAQAFAAPRVALVRAVRVEGAPTVPSRWLTRLDTVLEGGGQTEALVPAKPWRALYHALSRPERVERVAPPAPRPPVEARPRRLSVTRVETWMRDPYAVFAEQILGLRALDPLEADPGAAERGSFIHAALDAFVRETPGALPADALARLVACGERAFGAALGRPAVRAFWWPRFLRVAAWFLAEERRRRGTAVTASATEVSGRVTLPGPAGPFTLTAKADRIDRLADGGFAIIDYKTGLPPSDAQVALGYAPQLPLEALILAEGGFEGVERGGAASELAYWRLSGGEPAAEIRPLKGDVAALAAAARAGLAELIAAFDRPETPYLSVPRPEWAPAWNDYAHLARTMEWSAGAGGES